MPPLGTRSARVRAGTSLFFGFFVIAVVLQWRGNAFRSEFSGSEDEPAHYVTGLMIHDYVAAGFPGNPLAYARNYYQHYPKVALGHWPPVFYIIQASWMLIFGPSRISVLLLMASLAALLALTLSTTVLHEYSLGAGIAVGIFLLSLPSVEQYSRLVMAEIPLSLLVLLAIIEYGAYLDTERLQSAALFGLWAVLAILTKGTGIELAVVPPLALLATRRWRLLRQFSFWLPCLMVIGIAGPWYLWVPGAKHESVARFGGIAFMAPRVLGTFEVWTGMLGMTAAILAILGLFVQGRQFLERPVAGKWLAGASLLVGAYGFRLAIGAWEDRQLLTTVPILLMFSVRGASWLLSKPFWQDRARWLQAGAGGTILAAAIAWNIHQSPLKRHYGFDELARSLLSDPMLKESVFLVCTGANGEGMFISEVAMREPRPGHYVLRGNRILADTDLMGYRYRSLYSDQEASLRYVESIPVSIVVLDRETPLSLHGRLLSEALKGHPEKWARYFRSEGEVIAYRRIGHREDAVGPARIPTQLGAH